MSKRVVITSVICLIIGSSSLVSGLIVSEWIEDLIEDNVDEILLASKEEAIPIITDYIDLINFVETIGFMHNPTPFEEEFEDTGTIFDTLFDIMSIGIASDLILGWLFDEKEVNFWILGDTTFSGIINYFSDSEPYEFLGISEWAGEDLNFDDAKYNLMEGIGDLPGICDDIYNDLSAYSPEGAWKFLKMIKESKGNPEKEQALADGYGTSWYNIEKLASYYYDYYIPVVVPQNLNHSLINLIYPIQNMSKEDTANYFFHMQWANLLILENGLDLSEYDIIPGVPAGVFGLEAGYPEPMEMDISKIEELWNVSCPYAIVNNGGNRLWLSAIYDEEARTKLREALNISLHDMECMIQWRKRLTNSIIPVLGGVYLGWSIDLSTFRNYLQLGLVILGGALIVLGSTGVYKNHKFKVNKKESLKS